MFGLAFGLVACFILWLFMLINVTFLTVIVILLLIAVYIVGSVGINAVIYRKLCK